MPKALFADVQCEWPRTGDVNKILEEHSGRVGFGVTHQSSLHTSESWQRCFNPGLFQLCESITAQQQLWSSLLTRGLYRENTKDQIQIHVDCTLACLHRMDITTVEYVMHSLGTCTILERTQIAQDNLGTLTAPYAKCTMVSTPRSVTRSRNTIWERS